MNNTQQQDVMPEMDKLAQKAIVKAKLLKEGSVTNKWAIMEARIWRLAAVIHMLRREDGMEIETDYLQKASGKKGRICIYSLMK